MNVALYVALARLTSCARAVAEAANPTVTVPLVMSRFHEKRTSPDLTVLHGH